MGSKDSLGDRMKRYEDSFRINLPIRMPVILRLDGNHFHSYTKGLKRPFDENLVNVMNETAKFLCNSIQGCQLAYIQSDEISLLITNYQDHNTQSWFDNGLQKMISVSAGLASAKFTSLSDTIFGKTKLATFDCRGFVLPKEEVCNAFLWRQQDATRNSVQMLARSLYSHKECYGKNNSDLQEMCFQKGINWNDLPVAQRRGRCVISIKKLKKSVNLHTGKETEFLRREWFLDEEPPIFSKNRGYIDSLVFIESETFDEQKGDSI